MVDTRTNNSPAIRRLRLALLGLAIAVFMWSGIEDKDVVPVTCLGVALAVASTLWLLRTGYTSGARATRHLALLAAVVGAFAGAVSNLSTVGLMLFKNLRHAHPFPDYPPGLMLAMLERLPVWTSAGALIGLAVFSTSGIGRMPGARSSW